MVLEKNTINQAFSREDFKELKDEKTQLKKEKKVHDWGSFIMFLLGRHRKLKVIEK